MSLDLIASFLSGVGASTMAAIVYQSLRKLILNARELKHVARVEPVHRPPHAESSPLIERLRSLELVGGQLSLASVERRVSSLKPGEYIFIVATRRPRSVADRTKIARILGRQRWRPNGWAILPASDAYLLRQVAKSGLGMESFRFAVDTGSGANNSVDTYVPPGADAV